MAAHSPYKWHRLSVVPSLVLAIFALGCNSEPAQPNSFFGQEVPGREPVVFLPEILGAKGWPNGKLAFAPDQSEIFWSVLVEEQPRGILYHIRYDGNAFSDPTVASFTEGYRSGGPALSHDGERLFFSTRRPYPDDQSALVFGIWRATKAGTDWGEVKPVDSTIDSNFAVGHPTISRSGSLYFSYREVDSRLRQLFWSESVNGEYSSPRAAGGGLDGVDVMDPFVDPDERFVVFVCGNCEENIGPSDLFVSFRRSDGSWGEAVNIGNRINTAIFERFPSLSPDGKLLFFVRAIGRVFSSDRHYYWVSSEILEDLRPE